MAINFNKFMMLNLGLILVSLVSVSTLAAAPVRITLLHTNDIHSHYRPDRNTLGLGGVARIKTAVTRVRSESPNTLFVDAGDWSEGNVYYFEGAGREALRMMDLMGYDVVAVGNHDWLNGPDTLLNVVQTAKPSFPVLAGNISLDDYPRREEFRRFIPPYTIRTVAGVKIAFIGLVPYEFIYDRFFKPVKIIDPFNLTRELAARLKSRVDAVIAISHNNLSFNKSLLEAAPDVDLVVGAHDHVKLTRPIVVSRPGKKDGWIVETGCHGRNLGRVDFDVSPDSQDSVNLVRYSLQQIDATIPEDPEILARIVQLEKKIAGRMGPIFEEYEGHSEIELTNTHIENLMGDFVTDAYRNATHADIAVDHSRFIYGYLSAGDIRTVDVLNSNPGVLNASTGKAWTVHTLPITGRTLKAFLNIFYAVKAVSQKIPLNFSGLEIVFDSIFKKDLKQQRRFPLFVGDSQTTLPLFPDLGLVLPNDIYSDLNDSIIKEIRIGDRPLDLNATYNLAMGQGMVEVFEFVNAWFGANSVPLGQLRDTDRENWRVMTEHLRAITPITPSKVPHGNRIRTLQPDLGIQYSEIKWQALRETNEGMLANLSVQVRNYGATSSPGGPIVRVLKNANGANYAVDEVYSDLAAPQKLPALAPGEFKILNWSKLLVPKSRGIYPVTARIEGNPDETDHLNDQMTRWFR